MYPLRIVECSYLLPLKSLWSGNNIYCNIFLYPNNQLLNLIAQTLVKTKRQKDRPSEYWNWFHYFVQYLIHGVISPRKVYFRSEMRTARRLLSH